MKKHILCLVALLCTLNASALDYEPQEGLSWQAEFGLSASNLRGALCNGSQACDLHMKAGLDAGVRLEYMLPECRGTFVNVGLLWQQKGATHREASAEEATSGRHVVNAHYLTIPVHAGFRFGINDLWSVSGELGPYFAMGIVGRNRYTSNSESSLAEQTLNYSYRTFKKVDNTLTNAGGLQRFDAGLGFRVGTEYAEHYSLNLGMDWGLTDMLRQPYRQLYRDTYGHNAQKLRNFCLSLTLGYRF